MIDVSKCVICDYPIRQIKRALVAPFLAERIWNRSPFCVDLVQCADCGFMFYNPRLDEDDLVRLYCNYRSAEYQQMRHASEPWYSVKFNEDLASTSSYEIRRAKLATILTQHIGERKIRRILDYGGDRGDLVVGLLKGADAFVYEISGVLPADGVTSVGDPISCEADLIINSNVLEHVGSPRNLVRQIIAAGIKDGLIYLEVPCEQPFGLTRIVRRVAQIGIMAGAHPALIKSIVRPASLYMMHEHINYFTEQSLTKLMSICGGRVIASGVYSFTGRAGKADLVWCLGTNT